MRVCHQIRNILLVHKGKAPLAPPATHEANRSSGTPSAILLVSSSPVPHMDGVPEEDSLPLPPDMGRPFPLHGHCLRGTIDRQEPPSHQPRST